ncbi:unnamed protein product [Brassicogethes aeneus]|uniref:C2H2-type domain-containing protein n=1 Tax=Brassicogethes aeneus TaxID=1431903 RepID=A0A9P0B9B3_BRAAE|nr:unnamed protein product [Brassicogethes aeneus]
MHMELKDAVIMDITEAFRNEDITKTDFFDFVVTPDSNDNHSIQQFTKQMRTVNAFLGNGETTGEEVKETNNNSMLIQDVPTTTSEGVTNFEASFWNDKETVRIETAILEDLNKYCWNTDDSNGVVQINANKNNNNNTDGQIYTLTVLNGIDQNATWYRQPLNAIVKDEEGSVSSPTSMEHLQSGLDIESILSIMPGTINGFTGTYSEGTMSPNTDGLIKSETYTYEDSGFADNKEELANSLIIDTPLLEAHDSFNNNNNDWKLTNNNTTNSTSSGSPDSLLRSALQGKAFVRYNGSTSKSPKIESNTELRRALSTPPSKTETIFLKEDSDNIPTIVAGIDANGKVIFEEQINTRSVDSENPSSTHTVDDLLLSQLDHSFPEDFEKLKRIANEVAESVNQYCQIDTSADNTVNSISPISPDQIGILYNLSSPIQIQTAPVVTSTKPATKKYKRSNSGAKSQTTVQSATSTSNGVRKERSLHYCSICSKGFKDKYSVNVHIRTHTGEKPFACSLCGKSFRQKAHLAKHYQTHIAQKNAAAAGGAVPATKAKSR